VRRTFLIAAITSALAAPLACWETDRLEETDAFCRAYHLPSGAPLHERNLADFREHREYRLGFRLGTENRR